jgi:hypothetical protein
VHVDTKNLSLSLRGASLRAQFPDRLTSRLTCPTYSHNELRGGWLIGHPSLVGIRLVAVAGIVAARLEHSASPAEAEANVANTR